MRLDAVDKTAQQASQSESRSEADQQTDEGNSHALSENYTADYGKQGGINADAESKREDGNHHKRRRLPQHSEAIPNVLEQCLHRLLLFEMKTCQRVDAHGAAGWYVAGQQGNQRHDGCDRNVGNRVESADAVKFAG
jgi:hypothetical protein